MINKTKLFSKFKDFFNKFTFMGGKFIGIGIVWDNCDIALCLPLIVISFKYK